MRERRLWHGRESDDMCGQCGSAFNVERRREDDVPPYELGSLAQLHIQLIVPDSLGGGHELVEQLGEASDRSDDRSLEQVARCAGRARR